MSRRKPILALSTPALRGGFALLLALAPLPNAAAETARYRLDPVHTRVMFAVSHAGFSDAIGTVSGSTGTLEFDPQNWAAAKLEVRVPLERIDLGDDDWNDAAMGRRLLNVDAYPEASFVSTRVEPIDAERASVYGVLQLHGVKREVKLDVKLNSLKRHPMPPFRHTAGFSATATLDRMDFGIDAWKAVIGNQVELRIEAEAVRDNSKGKGEDESPHAFDAEADEPASPPAQDESP